MPRSHTLPLDDLAELGTVDERLQSYNVEMAEVVGGTFWKPYGAEPDEPATGRIPVGVDPSMYRYRPPIDLTDQRLRKLALALAPAYVRVSGTWANTVYFHDSETEPPSDPPDGFTGVLTRGQWKRVLDFVDAVGGALVTSTATGTGVRDADGVWQPDQARRQLDYTRAVGGSIAATEFMNEPTYAAMGGAPEGYDAAAFGKDVEAFRGFLAETDASLLFVGPGSVGEGGSLPTDLGDAPMLSTDDLLRATGPVFAVFSYHFYGAVSERMKDAAPEAQTTAADALSSEWLSRTDRVHAFYAKLRDQFMPGAPMWLTETAESAAGGNPWAATFTDSFRYLYQLGSLAQRGVQSVMHNTLASSDYGLLDEDTYRPRPNYWAALLWRMLMGTRVLDPGPPPSPDVHLFAHDRRGTPDGVALLIINADEQEAYDLETDRPTVRYALSAADAAGEIVNLNGRQLGLSHDGQLPEITGEQQSSGTLTVEPRTITFLTTAA